MQQGTTIFARAAEAIIGEPPGPNTQKLLLGVVKIEHKVDSIILTREDGEILSLNRDSESGRTLLQGIDKCSDLARAKFGNTVAETIEHLSCATVDKNTISLQRSGPEVIPVEINQKQDKKYWVKEIRLRDITFDVIEHDGRPAIRNVNGVTALLDAFGWPAEFKEFDRKRNSTGFTQYTVGIKNPIPKALLSLFRLDDILHLKFTEHDDEKKKVETDDSEVVAQPPGAMPAPAPAASGSVPPSTSESSHSLDSVNSAASAKPSGLLSVPASSSGINGVTSQPPVIPAN